MVDWILAPGGFVLIGIGLVAWFKSDWLWRLYSLEPRWRKDNPEKPDDWETKSKRQGYYFLAFGVIFILLSYVLASG